MHRASGADDICCRIEVPLAPLMRCSGGMVGRMMSLPMSETVSQARQGGPITLLVLDTCYILDLAKKGRLREALSSLKEIRTELVITSQVLGELDNQYASRRKDDDGQLLLDLRSYMELHLCISEGLLTKADVAISDGDRKLAAGLLKRASAKGNSRLGEGELSMLVFVREMGSCFQCAILSRDSDLEIFGEYLREDPPSEDRKG